MPEVSGQGFVTNDPGVYIGTIIGTAAGTTTIKSQPCFFQGIFFPNRVAAGSVIIYDSVGTSSAILGTIVLGTQTFSDPPQPYILKQRTATALTIVNSANLGAIVYTGI